MKRLRIVAAAAVLLALLAFVQPASAAVHIGDSGFELGSPNPYWVEKSTVLATPLIVEGAGANSGTHYAYLGGCTGCGEVSTLKQDIALSKNGTATLHFWLRIADYDPAGTDKLVVKLDGDTLLTIPETAGPSYSTYESVAVIIDNYLDGDVHTLKIKGTDKSGGKTAWYVDGVVILFNGVENSSMQIDDNGDRVPDGWKIDSPSGSARRVCDVAHTGTCSVRLPGSGDTETLQYTFKAAGTGATGDQFNFWYWIASEDAPASSVAVATEIFYSDGGYQAYWDTGYPAGTHAFGLYGWSLNTLGPYKKIRISFMYTASVGRIWVDNVDLVLVGFTP